jgi:hypothetical protein
MIGQEGRELSQAMAGSAAVSQARQHEETGGETGRIEQLSNGRRRILSDNGACRATIRDSLSSGNLKAVPLENRSVRKRVN